MKIFVTGASGYIGNAVAQELRRAGHHVIGLARSQEATRSLAAQGFETLHGDLARPETLTAAVRASDVTIHTAAFVAPGMSHESSDQSIFDATRIDRNAIEAMLGALRPGAKFVYTTGSSIYGGTDSMGADETVRPAPPYFLSWRLPLEDEIASLSDRVGIVLRPPVVYGRGRTTLIETLQAEAERTRRVNYIDDGESLHSLVHIDDLAVAYRLAVEKIEESCLLNVDGGSTISMRRLAELVAQSVGPDVAACSISISQALETAPLAIILAANNVTRSDRARNMLSWSPCGPSLEDEFRSGSYRRLGV